MPSFSATFSDEQVNELVAYIRTGIENVDEYKFQEVALEPDTFQSEDFAYIIDTVASGFSSVWGIAFLPNNDMLVTDKSGELYRIDEYENKTQIRGVPPLRYEGQGGLMDVEVHPDFESNSTVYLTYSIFKPEGEDTLTTTAVSRFVLDNDELKEGDLIFEALPYSTRRHHYGSRLEFDDEGYLFVTVGDRGARNENPQNLSLFPGKVHRIYDDGRIPEDNPFVNVDTAVASVYSYGHRNPQGITKHPVTGKMWEHEHGPRGGDELNIIEAGLNYGWPIVSYGINYDGTVFTSQTSKDGMQQPNLFWVPSIAPCGMDFVESDKYPGWDGHLLVGSLRFEYLNLCKVEGDKVISEEKLLKNIGRVRVVRQGNDGYIYVGVERPGAIYRIVPEDEFAMVNTFL
ncbi:MAG: PQQ-dependent sugar dehydrogenase [Cyclobacteriaceae bacterium]